MAYRKPIHIAPATPRSATGQQDNSDSSRGTAGGGNTAPLAIPGSRKHAPVPPALPPPTIIPHCQDDTLPDHGWHWGNPGAEMRSEPISTLDSPTSLISQWQRRDSTRSLHSDELQQQRKHSNSTTAVSMRSPLLAETFSSSGDSYKDSLPSPSVPQGDNMLTAQRQSMSHAYDDMLKRKIGAVTPGKPFQQPGFALAHRTLELRLHDNSPDSPRKLSSSNNPHWDPGSQSLQASPSIMSSQQSYYTDELRASPVTDTFSHASSITSYGGSMQSVELAFGRHPAPPKRFSRESDLSLAMTAQSPMHMANSVTSPTSTSFPHNSSVGFKSLNPRGNQNTQSQDPSLQTVDTATRADLRPPYQQEEIVILPTHRSDTSPHLAAQPTHRLIMPMKRKGAPDSSERDGPPAQQIQQDGRPSGNSVSKPYPSPRSSSFAQPQHHHIPSSTDRLPLEVNPLSEHAGNSPYVSTLPIDPGLDSSSAHPYPIDAQQLAAAAAQSVSVNSHQPQEHVETIASTGNNRYQCDCCLKKPKTFNTEQELKAHTNEKQYVCPFCRNRFKNKNEMERHQMSLHLRDRSWSCAALERNYEAAFHPATAIPPNNPGHAQQVVPPPPAATDVCGYCGQHFPNPPDFVARGEHLTNVHKFAECNQSKKFWRADHFRQHLKHSHGGIPGKWTNMLEQACLKLEPSPLTSQQQDDAGGMAQQQVVHAARAAQAAAEQAAQQAVQQQQHHQHHQQAQHQRQNSHRQQVDESLQLPPLGISQAQAKQLQNATASAGMMLSTDSHSGPYPPAPNEFGPVMGGGPSD